MQTKNLSGEGDSQGYKKGKKWKKAEKKRSWKNVFKFPFLGR